MYSTVGKYIIFAGAAVMLTGFLIYCLGDKLNWLQSWLSQFRLGRLPGDIRVESKNGGGFYFPIVTCIVISLILNLIIGLIRRFFGS